MMFFLSLFPVYLGHMAPWIGWGFLVFAILAVIFRRRRVVEDMKTKSGTEKYFEKDPFHIIPLPDFDWRATEPLKFRNFKPKFHLTMGLTNTSLSNLIEIDSNYLSRLQYRTKIIAQHPSTTIQATPSVHPAINELYTWLTSTYLPTRFPTLFTLTSTTLLNTATSLHLPLSPPTDPKDTLRLLGQNVDNDIVLLLPSEDGDGYFWAGHVVVCPSGFDPEEKWGKKLRDVHGPVPGYKQKLERSMDRFFERLEVGKCVIRSNWMIQTHPHLFAAHEPNHLYENPAPPSPSSPPTTTNIDMTQTHFRAERQTLHRLPNTKAIIFMFKTYMYPIAELRDEGLGEELAEAIEGLKDGSVPGMWVYKSGVVWGREVQRFLRGERE